MKDSTRYIVSLCWVVAIATAGTLIFTKGFLLKRLVVEKNSTCHVDFTTQADHHGSEGCWMHSRFKRAVIVIVDALRFDFVTFNHSLPTSQELPYQNKLKIVEELLRKRPHNSRLYRFLADPPTTTMQRLKGLTTGSLPTFVDAGSNFASSEITEDNFIDQLLSLKKRITFMGDDTWQDLFPDRFRKAYPFPSLVVHDLHTVDNGVIKHLMPEMKEGDWELLIAHFLGVDHCGHRYGPYHSAMAEKLTQMDQVLRSVVAELDDDTVLFVMGDHGMTRTGDHGGDSQDELDASLFVYSPSFITSSPPQKGTYETISQIDFVPTLSLLMGSPIPYPNLGTVITDLFNYCPWWKTHDSRIKQVYHAVKALRLNAHQVHQYIGQYAELSDEFPYAAMTRLNALFEGCERRIGEMVTTVQLEGDHPNLERELDQLQRDYKTYLGDIRAMCQDIWAKFDLSSMLIGVSLLTVSLATCVLWLVTENSENATLPFYAGLGLSTWSCGTLAGLYLSNLKISHLIIALSSATGVTFFFGLLTYKLFTTDPNAGKTKPKTEEKVSSSLVTDISFDTIFPVIIVTGYAMSLFSNSYVVYEDRVTAFLLCSLAVYYFQKISSNLSGRTHDMSRSSAHKKVKTTHSFDIGLFLTSTRSILLVIVVFFGISLKLSQIFYACREEQLACEPNSFVQSLANMPEDVLKYKDIRYFFSIGCLIAIYCALRLWMKHYGNLNGVSPLIMCVKYGLPICVGSICFYWALEALPTERYDKLPTWQLTLFPRVAYISILLTLLVVLLKPLTIYILPKESDTPSVFGEVNFVPKMYNHIKMNWRQHFRGAKAEEKPPVVYGLATVFTATLQVVMMTIAILLVLLLGDGMAPTVLLLLVAIFILLELLATESRTANNNGYAGIPWCSTLSLALLGSVGFFTTGHQTVITTIRWEAAYHGFRGSFDSYAIPAILIVLNTFASYVLTTLALPLVVMWPHWREPLVFLFSKGHLHGNASHGDRGEYGLFEDQGRLLASLFRVFLGYITFFNIRLLATACCAAIHRRHLMVWKIFAPRFVYEGATYLLVCALTIVVFSLVLRINSAVRKWIHALEKS